MKPNNTDTVKGRLRQYADKVEHMENATFERNTGLGKGTLSRTEATLSTSNLIKISNTFPKLNMNWVLTGNGDMIVSESNINVTNEGTAGQVAGNVYNMSEVKNIAVETVCEEVKALNRIIGDLRKEKESLQKTNDALHAENMKQLEIINKLIK